jgi:nitroreductase
MDLFTAIKARRSIRKFTAQKVTDKQIRQLLEAARWAPSAGNLQSRFFVVVRQSRLKQQLQKLANDQASVGQASILIVVCADLDRVGYYGSRGRKLYAFQDATIAAQNIWLAATVLGLGAVWIGSFSEARLTQVLKLSKNLKPIAILAIGYPAESPPLPPRLPLKKIYKTI